MTLTGDQIPSAFVDENAAYLHDHSISLLTQAGALAGVRLTVAQRADGIIDALPADGRLDVEELVRLEESPYFDLLFPEEQLALPTLWPLLEAPGIPSEVVAFAGLEPLEIEERTVEPGDLIVPTSIQLVEFPAGLHATLTRLQLAFDSDDNDATVTLEDIDQALAFPGAFTPAEIADIEAARLHYVGEGETLASAVIGVPAPGEVAFETSLGPIVFALNATTRYEETRGSHLSSSNGGWHSYSVDIRGRRTIQTWPQLEEGQHLIVVQASNEWGRVLDPTPGSSIGPRDGLWLVELWDQGVRQYSGWAELPALGEEASNEQLELRQYVGQTFETLDGTPLQRNIRSTNFWSNGSSRGAVYSYDVGPVGPDGTIDPSIESAVALPRSSLPPGRYEVEIPNADPAIVDIFPEGAIRATYLGVGYWLHLNSNGSDPQWARRFTAYPSSGSHIQYRAAGEILRVGGNSGPSVVNTTLSLAHRTG